MIRLILLIFIVLAIATSAIWMIENNGALEITWLGYLVKTDIMTSIVILIMSYYVLRIFFSITSKIFSFNLASLKKFFRPNKLKVLTKTLQNDEKSFEIIFHILQDLENGNNKDALKKHKELVKNSKNQELNNFLLAKIYFNLGDFKKSQEIAKNTSSNTLTLASELEITLKDKDEEKTLSLADEIITKSSKKSQSEALKKSLEVKLDSLFKLAKYQEAKDLITSYNQLSNNPDFIKILDYINTSLAKESYDKKSFVSAIRSANKVLKSDPDNIPAQEIRLKSWLALGFIFKTRRELRKLWQKSGNLIFVDLFDQSNQKLSAKKRIKAIKKFLSKSTEKDVDFALALVAFRNEDYSLSKTAMDSMKSEKLSPQANKMLHFLNKILKNDNVIEGKSSNYQNEAKGLGKINHYNCSACDSYFETWQPKCSSCSAINTLKN